jgi:hypothetical protein
VRRDLERRNFRHRDANDERKRPHLEVRIPSRSDTLREAGGGSGPRSPIGVGTLEQHELLTFVIRRATRTNASGPRTGMDHLIPDVAGNLVRLGERDDVLGRVWRLPSPEARPASATPHEPSPMPDAPAPSTTSVRIEDDESRATWAS